MTKDQFDAAYRAFCRCRPFRAFVIEFTSSNQLIIGHPEAVRNEVYFYAMRRTDGGHVAFTAESVTRLLDLPPPAA